MVRLCFASRLDICSLRVSISNYKMFKDTDVFRLESLSGFNGGSANTVKNCSALKNTLVYGAGGNLVVENTETGKQMFFIKHKTNISCIAVDQSGRFIATGEVGQPTNPNY